MHLLISLYLYPLFYTPLRPYSAMIYSGIKFRSSWMYLYLSIGVPRKKVSILQNSIRAYFV